MSRAFTVRGNRNGSKVHVSWTDGRLDGDPPTVDLMIVEAELVAFNPAGRHTWGQFAGGGAVGNPLADASSTWLLVKSVFDSISEVEGEAPPEAFEELRRAGRRTDAGPAGVHAAPVDRQRSRPGSGASAG